MSISSQIDGYVGNARSLSTMMGPLDVTKLKYPAHYRKTCTRWYTPNCPNQDECSVTNWAATDQCRSYDSESKCRTNIFNHLKSDAHNNQSYTHGQLWQLAESAQVAKCTDMGLWFPDDLQKPEDEEVAVYHMKYNGPYAPKKGHELQYSEIPSSRTQRRRPLKATPEPLRPSRRAPWTKESRCPR